ncbi:MAG TPA: oligosaccharide flippase family protein [Chitinophagaceae bacterium]|nr:oligosaccharide flippase family protein [Chitinophagaceae bacterium]
MIKKFKLLIGHDLFKAVGVYTVSGILTKAIPFLLLPVYTHFLTTSDYGIISLISSSILALMPFINLGMTDLITIEYKKQKSERYLHFQSTVLTISFLFCFFMLVFAVLFSKFFSQLSTLPTIGVLFVPILTYFGFCNDLLATIVRNDDRRKLFLILNVSRTVIESSLAVILIVIFKMQWMGRVDSIFIAGAVFTFFLFYYIFYKRQMKLNLNLENIKSIVKFGLPTIPLYFMIFTLYNADKFVISKISNSKEGVGLYTVAFQIAYIIQIFVTAFNTAFLPKLYDWIKEDSEISKVRIVKVIYISTALIFVLGVALYLLSPILYHFFIDQKYHSSIRLLPYFIFCFVIWNLFVCFLPFIFYFKKNNYLYIVNGIVITISLVSLNFFVKQFGLVGACLSNIFSFSFLIVLIGTLANKTYQLPWLYFITVKNKS